MNKQPKYNMSNFDFEDRYPERIIAGVDEVGRGAWAGPLVVAAVIIERNKDVEGIADSKTLSKKSLLEMDHKIRSNHIYAIGEATIEEIYKYNINGATSIAMNRALDKLPRVDMVFVDGNIKLNREVQKLNIIKGDSLSTSIAAASIVAKVYRDSLMCELSKTHPEYHWEKNVGYGTKKHMEALEKYGLTDQHRLGYRPIAALAPK